MKHLFVFLCSLILIFGCSNSSSATANQQGTPAATTVSNKMEQSPSSIESAEEKPSIQMEKKITPAKKSEKETNTQKKANKKDVEVELSDSSPKTNISPTPQVKPEATLTKAKENIEIIEEKPIESSQKPNHSNWNTLLQTYVSASGKVNYRNWKSNTTELNNYLNELAANEPENSWSKSEKLAYWMNLYNAATIKLILDHYPVKSIMDIDNGKPWNRKWIKVDDKTYSLNQIENDIIRPRFGDARIHFGINCAAKSCPPISNKAFTASNLNSSLNALTRKFINNTAFNTISENKLELSKIFDWYASDFGDLRTYIAKYADTSFSADAKVSYSDYDWALNNQ